MNTICLLLFTVFNGLTWAELDLKQLCLDQSKNDVLAHPEECRGYIVCSSEPSVHYCEEGFHFDSKRMICNWPEDANCQLAFRPILDVEDFAKPVYTSLMALDITTGAVIDPMSGYEPLNVVCRHFGAYFLPNPTQCRSYYLCAYGHMHEHSCGPDTLWNYETQQCVLSYKAVCYQMTEEEEMEINESLTSLMHNDSVVCYPVNTNATTMDVLPAHNSAQSATKTTAPVAPILTHGSTTVFPKSPNLDNPYHIKCPPRRQSYVAHPEDCSKYFMCIMGKAVMTSCPEDLLWDAREEYCVSSKHADCFRGKRTT